MSCQRLKGVSSSHKQRRFSQKDLPSLTPCSEPWTLRHGLASKREISLDSLCSDWGEGQRAFPHASEPDAFSFQVDHRNSAIIQGLQFFGTCCQETGRPARASLGRGIGFQPKAVKCKPRAPTGSLGAFPLQTIQAECRYRARPC